MKTWNDIVPHLSLGIGTWAWGDKRVWGYGKDYSDRDLKGAFESCIAAEINFFDTAEVYGFGRSEELIGQFIREQHARIVVATKFMPFPWRAGRKSLNAALERSRRRLGLESVHLYQIHWPLHVRSLNSLMDDLANVVKEGFTLAVGVSNYSTDQMKRAFERLAHHGIPLASNQVEYNLLHRHPEKSGLWKTCNDLGVKLIAYSPLAMGVLTGKYSSSHKLNGYRGIRYNRFLTEIEKLIGLIREIGQSHGGKSPSQVALNWTISKGTFPIPGAKNAQQAIENSGAQGWRLTEDEIRAIEGTAESIR